MLKLTKKRILAIFLILLLVISIMLIYFSGLFGRSKYTQGIPFPRLIFDKPVDFTHANDESDRLFVVEQQNGKIKSFKNSRSSSSASTFLDLSDRLYYDWEGGFLGLVFHPNFKNNGLFYVYYTINDTSRSPTTDNCKICINSTLSQFKVDINNPNKANISSEIILLEIPQFDSWHRGGKLHFGPDDMLYVHVGEAKRGGQNLGDFYGKILRLDVNKVDKGLNYSIPTDNPFYNNTSGYKEEIYAYGLRNPWRGSFDFETDTFWLGDVGEDDWEEINIIEKGKNYGWPIKEGDNCYRSSTCNNTGLTDPIHAYPHEPGGSINDPYGISVIGGFVYRGDSFPELKGKYIFADYFASDIDPEDIIGSFTGVVWAAEFDGSTFEIIDFEFLFSITDSISSIGADINNELYFLGHNNGIIFNLNYASDVLMKILIWFFGILLIIAIIIIVYRRIYKKRRAAITSDDQISD